MLSQARAVREGMIIGCWVGGTTLVRFTVGEFFHLSNGEVPTDRSLTDSTSPSASPALLLTSDTELIVAPKTRQAVVPSTKSHDLTSTPSAPSSSRLSSPIWDALRRKLVRLLPLEGFASSSAEHSATEHLEALVSPALYRSLKAIFPSLRVNLIHHARPIARGGGSSGEATAALEANGSGKEKESGKDEKRKEVEVRVKESRAVPAGHVWIGDAARAELGLSLAGEGASEGGFDLLR